MKYIWALLVVFLPAFAFAAPGIPEAFYGTAISNVEIDALMGTTTVASTTSTVSGTYGYAPNLFLLPDPDNSLAGSIISFAVGGAPALQTAIFENGAITNLDLTAAAPSDDSETVASTSTDQEVEQPSPSNSGGGTLAATATSSIPDANLIVTYDFNGDGKVDALDFNDLLAHWGVRLPGLPEDLNGDGVVDLFDLNLFFAHWHV